jgi:hypothetical protein
MLHVVESIQRQGHFCLVIKSINYGSMGILRWTYISCNRNIFPCTTCNEDANIPLRWVLGVRLISLAFPTFSQYSLQPIRGYPETWHSGIFKKTKLDRFFKITLHEDTTKHHYKMTGTVWGLKRQCVQHTARNFATIRKHSTTESTLDCWIYCYILRTCNACFMSSLQCLSTVVNRLKHAIIWSYDKWDRVTKATRNSKL